MLLEGKPSGLEGNGLAGLEHQGRGRYLWLGLLTLNLPQRLHLRRPYPLPPRTKPISSRCLHPLKALTSWSASHTAVHTGSPGLTVLAQSNGGLGTQRPVWSE